MRSPIAFLALLAGCATAPEPRIEVREVRIPVPVVMALPALLWGIGDNPA